MPKEFLKSLSLAIGLHGALLGILIFLWPFWSHSVFSFDRYRIYKISLVSSPYSFQSMPKEAKKISSSKQFETSKKSDIRTGSALPMAEAIPIIENKPVPYAEEQGGKKDVGPEGAFSMQVSFSENPSGEKRGGGEGHQSGNNKETLVSLSSGTGFAAPSVLAVPRYGRNNEPDYPAIAREQGWQGTTLLKVQVLKNGLVGSLEVLRSSGFSILDQSALKGVKEWKFIPAQKDGQPIEIGVEIPVTFRLE